MLQSSSPASPGYLPPFLDSAVNLSAIAETEPLIRSFLTAERIRSIRCSLNMTQCQLAEALGVSQPHISRAENGEYGFSYTVAVRLLQLAQSAPESIAIDTQPTHSATRRSNYATRAAP